MRRHLEAHSSFKYSNAAHVNKPNKISTAAKLFAHLRKTDILSQVTERT
jgi:hypothetical protein